MRKIIIILLLFVFAMNLQAQIIVTSTRANTDKSRIKKEKVKKEKVKKDWHISYRGYLEAAGTYDKQFNTNFYVSTAHGLQVSPHVWIGIGVSGIKFPSMRQMYEAGKIEAPVGRSSENILDDYSSYQSFVVESYEMTPHHYYAEHGKGTHTACYLETRINLLKNKYAVIPYISIAGGLTFNVNLDPSAFAQFKVGATRYFKKKHSSLSAFIGVNFMRYRYYIDFIEYIHCSYWSNYSGDRITTRNNLGINKYEFPGAPYLTFGLNFDFGGGAGFKERKK